MRIQHNIMAMNAYRNYTNNTSALSKNLEKLSSGYRINRAGDDAAGLAISEKMRAQITGLDVAQKNAKDGISLVQTAEGALTEVHDMLNRMVELANQSANGTYENETDRVQLQKEIGQLRDEINRIADSANFNGQKLLDGTLSTNPDSAIGKVTTSAYQAAGASDAFKATFVTNRPEAATTQANAKFTVSFDDIKLDAIAAGSNTLEVTIGGTKVNLKFADATAKTGADIARQLTQSGFAAGNATEFVSGGGKPTVDTSTTAKWGDEAAKWTNDGTATADNKYIEIDGNYYKMTANQNAVTFEQVNYTGESGEVINPDFAVSVDQGNAGGKVTGTVNPQVQVTNQGTGIGSTHQAQANVAIDFSKLKDGDTLTAGDKTYVFKIGENSQTQASGGEVLVDLSQIFKTDADLSDAAKQAEAMVKITDSMGNGTANNTTWSVGNGGVKGNVGTLTFQSKSGYTDGVANIAGTQTAAKMDTEANVMAQFFGNSVESAAKTSFELDVTKLRAGDTVQIGDVTFEFTDGPRTSKEGYVAVDLSALGISGGIPASKTDTVTAALENAIETNLTFGDGSARYDVAVDGKKITLTSKDYGTSATFENRTAASVSTGGGLTLQIGDTSESFNQLTVSVKDCHAEALGIGGIDIATQKGAQDAVNVIKDAINYVSDVRGTLGATQNRLDHTINNLSVMEENIQDAESTIRDTDVADEMMAYTKNNILIQSAQAMLAQANQVPQGVLQLLQ